MEKIIYQYYLDLFASHVLLPSYKLKEDEHDVAPVLPSKSDKKLCSVEEDLRKFEDLNHPHRLQMCE
ncbi:hypothetical protein KIN20_034669 [Parelaphostrongylus tenuis]|uniref:Uncharacterized protein n=1 Tax=Parelaphostrongylus tenuis TaxID=148309 RepID=A0AAD5RAS0_PARTN|nr:hypothetical protein KIN20_034669 [Parelaphostrongylus tenuis]